MAFRILALVTLVFAGTKTHHHDEFKNLPVWITNQIKNVETVMNKCNMNEDGEVDSEFRTMCMIKKMGIPKDISSLLAQKINQAKTIVDKCKANHDGKVDVKSRIKCAFENIGMEDKDVDTFSNFLVTEFNRGEAVANECKQKEDGQEVDKKSQVMCVLKKMKMEGDAQNLSDIVKVLSPAMKSLASKFMAESPIANEMKSFTSRFIKELPLENEESSENDSSMTQEDEEEEVPQGRTVEEATEAFESSESSSTVHEEVMKEPSENGSSVTPEKKQAELNFDEKFLRP